MHNESEEGVPKESELIKTNSEADHHFHKPKLFEYFFNFIMMFLAVFLGFFGENYRESLSDQNKERDFVKSLILNLKDDSVKLSQLIPKLKLKQKGLDSLATMSNTDFNIPGNRSELFSFVFTYIPGLYFFKNNNATLTQLKNGGNLRLLQKDHVADSIAKYDIFLSEVQITEFHLADRQNKVIELIWQLGDFTSSHDPHWEIYFRKKIERKNNKRRIFQSDADVPSITADKQTLIMFFNWVLNYSWSTDNYIELLEQQMKNTNKLIGYLKNEYSIL